MGGGKFDRASGSMGHKRKGLSRDLTFKKNMFDVVLTLTTHEATRGGGSDFSLK